MEKKDKYILNLVFDKKYEEPIRQAAADAGLPIATFIKQCVLKELKGAK